MAFDALHSPFFYACPFFADYPLLLEATNKG